MALDYIQPAVQVRKVAKLLQLATIRVKRGEIPKTSLTYQSKLRSRFPICSCPSQY